MGATSRRTRQRGVHLTSRDLQVLELLVTRRAETLAWIHEQHFAGLSRKRALNRLGDLAAAGYLRRVTVTVPGATRPESAYTLGPRGKAALELRSLAGEHFRHRRFNPTLRDSSIPHQILVNRVADWLGADLTPEHLLPMTSKEQWRHKPDGVYQALNPREDSHPTRTRAMVWLEVDLGHYSRERIKGKLRAFHADEEAGHLLLVTHTAARANQIARWLNTERFGRAITIASLTELIADPELARNALPAPRQTPQDPFEHVPAVDGLRIPELPPPEKPWCPEEDGWA